MNLDDSRAAVQLHALAETTPDALLTIDAESRIQFANPAVEDVFGYAPEELVGESLTVLMSEPVARRHTEAIDRYLGTGTRQLDWDHVELVGRHADGHDVPISVSFSEFTVDGEQYFTGVIRDISERKTLEAERDLLHATKDQVVRADSFAEGLTNAIRLIGESMNWACGEAWVSADDGRIRWEAGWNTENADVDEFRARSTETVFEPGDGLVGRVWETGEYEWIPDISTAEDTGFERAAAAESAGLKTAVGIPIRTDGTVVAVLVFLMREECPVDDRSVEVTRTIAANLGLLVARKRAEDALYEERDLLSNILETTPAGIAVLDGDGEFSYVNGRAEELLRVHPDADGTYPPVEELPLEAVAVDGTTLPDSVHPYHTVFGTGEDVSRDMGIRYLDGEQRWLTVHGTPLRDETGEIREAVFAFEDVTDLRRQATQLERLNELGQDLSETETFEDACELAVDAACDILDLPVTAIERYDADSGRLERCARTSQVDELVGDDPLFPPESDLPWQVFARGRAHVSGDLAGEPDLDVDGTPLGSTILLPLGEHGVFVGGATEPDAFSETDVKLARILSGNVESVFDRLRREASLRERTAELETQSEHLRRVQRVNREIRDITQALLDATSKTEIKQVVCDRLANSGDYQFVWFGERDLATDEIVATASAGVEEGYLDAVGITAGSSETGQEPVERALRTSEAQIRNNLQADPPFDPWQQEALQRGYRASIAVPVAYNGTTYGLVTLYANQPEVFTEMEEAVLTELGEMIGYTLNAMERYDALVSEEAIELEFVVRDRVDPLLRILREEGGSIRLESVGKREEGRLHMFVAVDGLHFETLRTFVDEHVGGDATLIRDRNEEHVVELSLPRESFPGVLVERGAMPTAIRATPDGGRITVRIPESASVREFVDLFERLYDDVDLVARRESPESIQTRGEFERAYVDRLTERQQEVLQTAYFAGFFEQPRESTAQDVAEMLGVSQPTVSRHLRNSQQKLFAMLFGEE